MEKLKRSERMALMLLQLAKTPNRLYTLSSLNAQFGAAKSTLSEDITAAKLLLERTGMGKLETVSGAAGGVKFLPFIPRARALAYVEELCAQLSDPARIVPGGFIYTVDLFTNPSTVRPLGHILAGLYYRTNPDVIVTVESSGVPVAMTVAEALDKPLIIARRDNRITDGSVVTINYLSTSSKRLLTMSLPSRAIHKGQKALIIDDFIKGGGTVSAICNIMKEFSVMVVGVGSLIKSGSHVPKLMHEIKSLAVLEGVDEDRQRTLITPAGWLQT